MHTSSITVLTSCRLELVLNPVPMQVMPSQNSEMWLAFIARGQSTYSFPVALPDVERIQEFMILHSTECLSDGNRNYTIYGRSLVACYPELVGEQ